MDITLTLAVVVLLLILIVLLGPLAVYRISKAWTYGRIDARRQAKHEREHEHGNGT